ncbi:MAG: hypothetical protein PHT96_07435 [Syntrophorhabdaceae bacterium]|nr:hypothetical protein [Syntrophorhabdaceae bacterium]MDD4196226.1 hypothetical protein [Syntrophorhabdaceae bacterium]
MLTVKHRLSRIFANNRAMVLDEAQKITGFMHLLMKPRNTGQAWTSEEKRVLRKDLKHLSCYVPALVIFVLPFGSLLIPVLAEILDRRKTRRRSNGNLDVAGHGHARV